MQHLQMLIYLLAIGYCIAAPSCFNNPNPVVVKQLLTTWTESFTFVKNGTIALVTGGWFSSFRGFSIGFNWNPSELWSKSLLFFKQY